LTTGGACPVKFYHFCSLIDSEKAPLRVLHSAGYVHCDIRPANVMRIPGSDRLALVDLGAARAASDAMTCYAHGTLVFASPKLRGAFFNGTLVQRTIMDDLISLAYCVIVSMFSMFDAASQVLHVDSNIDSFWQQFNDRLFACQLLKIAESGNYTAMCTLIMDQHASNEKK